MKLQKTCSSVRVGSGRPEIASLDRLDRLAGGVDLIIAAAQPPEHLNVFIRPLHPHLLELGF